MRNYKRCLYFQKKLNCFGFRCGHILHEEKAPHNLRDIGPLNKMDFTVTEEKVFSTFLQADVRFCAQFLLRIAATERYSKAL